MFIFQERLNSLPPQSAGGGQLKDLECKDLGLRVRVEGSGFRVWLLGFLLRRYDAG